MTAQHTPTPWEGNGYINGSKAIIIYSKEIDKNIATVYPTIKEYQANAQFIVKACNSHEELLEACNKVLSALTDKYQEDIYDEHIGFPEARLLEKAIAHAEGKE